MHKSKKDEKREIRKAFPEKDPGKTVGFREKTRMPRQQKKVLSHDFDGSLLTFSPGYLLYIIKEAEPQKGGIPFIKENKGETKWIV